MLSAYLLAKSEFTFEITCIIAPNTSDLSYDIIWCAEIVTLSEQTNIVAVSQKETLLGKCFCISSVLQ